VSAWNQSIIAIVSCHLIPAADPLQGATTVAQPAPCSSMTLQSEERGSWCVRVRVRACVYACLCTYVYACV
jgi:hypothetical protein